MAKVRSRGQNTRQTKRARFEAATESRANHRLPILIGAVASLVLVLVVASFLLTRNPGVPQAGSVQASSVSERPTKTSEQAANTGGGSAKPATVSAVTSTNAKARYTPAEAVDGAVRLPTATFADGKARFYSLVNAGKSIDFFVLKSTDGVVRAAFDACDVCFPAHKGYHQEGDEMVCNNCGRRFPSVQVNEVKGGCNPSPLQRSTEGGELVLRLDDILAGATFF